MRSILTLPVVLLSLVSASCSVMPKCLGGRETCYLVIPNVADPTAPGVGVSLMSSGDAESERGIVELRMNRQDRAYDCFREACSSAAEADVNTLWLLGVSCELLGKFDEAESAYDKASRLATSQAIEAGYSRARQAQSK